MRKPSNACKRGLSNGRLATPLPMFGCCGPLEAEGASRSAHAPPRLCFFHTHDLRAFETHQLQLRGDSAWSFRACQAARARAEDESGRAIPDACAVF